MVRYFAPILYYNNELFSLEVNNVIYVCRKVRTLSPCILMNKIRIDFSALRQFIYVSLRNIQFWPEFFTRKSL